MINKINMEKKIKKRTIYRLLNYAWKYKWRFSYGILAGALVGLSIFGMLSSLDNLFDPDAIEESTLHIQAETIKKTDYTEKILYFFGYEKLNDDGTLTFPATALILLVLPFFIALKGLFTYINCYCMRYVGTSTIADIRNDLFKNLSNQSLQFYSKNSAGNLISRIFNDTGVSEQLISSSIADLTRGPMEIFACFVFIIYQTVKLEIYSVSFAFIIGAPLCIFPVFLLGRKIKKMTRKSLEKISLLTMHMLETFTGIRVVKAYHMEKSECKRFVANNQKYVSKVLKGMKYELLVTPAMEFVAVLIICIFIIYTYCQGLVFKDIAPFGVAASLAYQPLKRISKVFANMQRSLMGAERAFDYIDLVPDLVETEGAIKISNFKDSFQFKNVDFSYEAQGEKIIDCLNLEIKKGETVAFVGETGSGKTTISNLLARFYDPTSGSVSIDGIDLREIKIESLRKLIGVVTQDAIIFDDTIAYNIAYGANNVTQKQIEEAAKKANAHVFIMEKENGFETLCGEKGFNLSGGEKQRISIARAILKNPPILILDEATSALDTLTENLVQGALHNLMERRTVFAIAHRLSTIQHANKICVLEEGCIIEYGSHEELYKRDGKYAKLYNMQFHI